MAHVPVGNEKELSGFNRRKSTPSGGVFVICKVWQLLYHDVVAPPMEFMRE